MLTATNVWAQPGEFTLISDSDNACRDQVKFEFLITIEGGTDDEITEARIYLKRDDESSRRRIFSLIGTGNSGGDYGSDIPEHYDFVGVEDEYTVHLGRIYNQNSNNWYFETTVEGLNRALHNYTLSMEYSWENQPWEEIEPKTISKKDPINFLTVQAERDNCDPRLIDITVNGQLACDRDYRNHILFMGFHYSLDDIYFSLSDYSENELNIDSDNNFSFVIENYNIPWTTHPIEIAATLFSTGNSSISAKKSSFDLSGVDLAKPILNNIEAEDCDGGLALNWINNGVVTGNQVEIYRREYVENPSAADTIALQFGILNAHIDVPLSSPINLNGGLTIKLDDVQHLEVGNEETQTLFSCETEQGNIKFVFKDNLLQCQIKNTQDNTERYIPLQQVFDCDPPDCPFISDQADPFDLTIKLEIGSSSSFMIGAVIFNETLFSLFADEMTGFEEITKITLGGTGQPYYNTTNLNEGFYGNIGQFGIYNAVVSDDGPPLDADHPDTYSYYDFQNHSPGVPNQPNINLTTIEDQSGHGRDGTLYGFFLDNTYFNYIAENTWPLIATVNAGTGTYIDNDDTLIPNQPYEYMIRTFTEECSGTRVYSPVSVRQVAAVPTLPASPENLVLTLQEDNTVLLEWEDLSIAESGFEIVRRLANLGGETVFSVDADTTSFIDNNLVACQDYIYSIRATNFCGQSEEISVPDPVRLEPDLSAVLSQENFAVSKGYFSDRVELIWEVAPGSVNLLNKLRIFRRPLGSGEPFSQIDDTPNNSNIYRDELADAGILYEYKIVGEATCSNDILTTNEITAIGYRTATGLVSGQVTSTGNNAVEGVKILANLADGTQRGRSLELDGVDDKVMVTDMPLMGESFTIEMWVKRTQLGESAVFGHGYTEAMFNSNLWGGFDVAGHFVFKFSDDNSLITDESYQGTDWHHWACTYNAANSKRRIYRDGELVAEDTSSGIYMGNGNFQLGASVVDEGFEEDNTHFAGRLDEVRIWKTNKSSVIIARDYNRILNPNETDLLATWSVDEGIGDYIYDRSKVSTTFNKRHGYITGTTDLTSHWSDVIPNETQLSIYGITNDLGNYVMASIPYQGSGQAFTITPMLGTHEFSPSQTNLYIGNNVDIHNNINFTDISSFPVTGTVFYEGSSCPAAGVELRIDGQTALINEEPVVTNDMGFFTVDVPIGEHRISLYKEGHTFSVGKWPTDGSLYDFQEPISGIEFINNTTRKVVGRVVGGIREGNKPPALGKSVNNIGRAKIVFTSTLGNGCDSDTIYTDPQTGEYVADLLPLNYVIDEVRVLSEEQSIITGDFGILPQLTLSEPQEEQTVQDTIRDNDDNILEIITASYHKEQNFIYRKTAELTVYAADGQSPLIGEESYEYEDSEGNVTSFDLSEIPFGYPIFEQLVNYTAVINAFERYNNYDEDAPITEDLMPVTDGTLIIQNTLTDEAYQEIALDEDGSIFYDFVVGEPNAETNNTHPEYSYTKTMDITLQRSGQTEDVKWYAYPDAPNEPARLYRAYIFGGLPKTALFTTAGPEVVDMVIRDPSGSNSFSYLTKDSTYTTITSTESNSGDNEALDISSSLGIKGSIGVGSTMDVESEVSGGTNIVHEHTWGNEGEQITSTSFSTTISTKADPEDVGARGDVYIAKTLNVYLGVVEVLELFPAHICDLAGVECTDIAFDGYRIGTRRGIFATPAANTSTVIYGQDNIVNYIIPRLEEARNALFINQSDRYNSYLTADHLDYGTNNDDPIWGLGVSSDTPDVTDAIDKQGFSYSWLAQDEEEEYNIGTDSVRWYNQQIRLWEKAIRENEKDKVSALSENRLENDISISGGTVYSQETTQVKEDNETDYVEMSLDYERNSTINVALGNNGFNLEGSIGFHYNRTSSTTTTVNTSTTFGYEINDPDQGDLHNIRVYKSSKGWGPIFELVAGQTSCPHEPEIVTEYYQPETVISQQTAQRDKILAEIAPVLVQNVPAEDVADFNLLLNNISETNDTRIYGIEMWSPSNPYGANVSLDGQSLAIPQEFALGAGITSKTLTVERGPVEYEYNELKLLVYAPCQFGEGSSDEIDIVDTATFSVHFLPDCTDLTLKEPLDQWVLNNSNNDTLPVVIDDYNINYNGLEGISLQYKPAAEATWVELERFWHNSIPDQSAYIPTDRAFIRYNWDMAQYVDGDYNLRAQSICELNEDFSSLATGHADRINPHPFGNPEPADGICSPGEDLMIEFNETIDAGSLSLLNFDIRGVLNGTDLRHEESIAFDGENSYLEIPEYALTQRSFAVEFWAKRNGTGEEVVFSQGTNLAESIVVGFDAQDRFQLSINGLSIESNDAFTDGQWHHYVASYDRENSIAVLIVDAEQVGLSEGFNVNYAGEGTIFIGQSTLGAASNFDGNLHELRLWNTPRTQIADIVVKMLKSLNATTAGLVGNWPMNEAYGNITKDKVRSRHAELHNATWTILPEGQAFDFNGSSDYLELEQAGTIVMNMETDITLELWFKADSPGTLLSNSKADGSHDNQNGWALTMEDDGRISVYNDGYTMSTALNYLDNNWHHIAFVLDRNAGTSLLIDGELVNTGNTDNWNSFAGPKLWIACRGWINANSTEERDQYFGGAIDELRVWKVARKIEQVQRDFHSRMKGDEFGLMVYYPFEHYMLDAGVPVLQPTINDEAASTHDLTLGANTDLNYISPPAIKLQRPTQKVNFIYSINQDRIILTPTDPGERLENVTLDVTVQGVKDLYGNVMQSPATWTAYMDKNQVYWEDEVVSQDLLLNESGSFTGTIVNTGGTIENFEILNLPAWLSASPVSGTIAPNSSLDITFNIQAGVNIGTYNQDIYVVTDFGFNERLLLNLTVSASAPEWEINPNEFEYFMSYIGQLDINSVLSTDTNDKIAAFVGEELRGVATVEMDPVSGKYLVFLNVFSNSVQGEEIEFKIWDASQGIAYHPVTPMSEQFLLNAVVGTRNNPQIFSTLGSLQQTYSLSSGWNWLSFPLETPILMDVNETLESLNATTNDRLRSQNHFDSYEEGIGWWGNLSNNGGLNRAEGYRMSLSSPSTFSYSGQFLPASETPIPLETGWNWIGFIAQDNMDITTALSSLDPSDGDIIKGQTGFALYEEGLGWGGNLSYLEPGKSYMIKVANSDVLIYPGFGSSARPEQEKVMANHQQTLLHLQMEVPVRAYPTNMSLVATIAANKVFSPYEDLYLAAYSNEMCRGISPLYQQDDQWLTYLTLYGADTDDLRFELLVGEEQEVLALNEELTFQSDQLIGSAKAPFVFTLKKALAVNANEDEDFNHLLVDESMMVYPNPFNKQLNIQFELAAQDKVSIYLQDLNGRTVANIEEGTFSAGLHSVKWTGSEENTLPPGVYFVHLQSDNFHYTAKVVK